MPRRIAILAPVLLAVLAGAAPCLAGQIGAGEKPPVIRPEKKNRKTELPNRTLETLPAPPLAVAADGTRLSFVVAPLSKNGLLSQQTRDALRWLIGQAHGAQFVRLRAFVAGSGDLRRVPQLVSEIFADKHLPLPVVTTVQVGALPLEGAQVQIEATLQQSHAVNPGGVAFDAVEAATAEAALAKLQQAGTVLRATCFVPGVEGRTPAESLAWIQPQRLPGETNVWCEGAVRLNGGAAVPSQPLVFTGAQMAFSYSEEDAKLAYDRLEKTLKSANSTLKNAVFLSFYPLSSQLAEMAARVGPAYLDWAHRPAGIRTIVFEGLPSMDGSFAIEAVATVSNPNSR